MPVERRRHLRHKVHSPAYASVGAGVGGVVLDANDRGAAIETIARLIPQSFVDLRLDLLDTRGSAVTPARVAWCDEAGRAGLEFLNLTGESRRQLQQWLLLNTLLAAENASKLGKAGRPDGTPAAAALGDPAPQGAAGDPAWREAAERALAAAEGDGAAIALAEGEDIVCRATAGDIAPPPGTKLNTESGISGACVRSGRWLRCDDPRLDPHVDRESCAALGINSVLAVPIGQRGDILGLIEVFSRTPYAFKENHCSALQELAKIVALSLRPEAPQAPAVAACAPQPAPEAAPEEPARSPGTRGEEAQVASQAAAAVAPTPAVTNPARPEAPVPAAMEVSTVPLPAANQIMPPAPAPDVNAAPAPSPAPSSGKGERVVLIGLVGMLVLLGLWFVLGRGTGDARSVDAASPSPSLSQTQPQPTASRQTKAEVTQPTVTLDLSDSVRPLRREAESGDAEAAFELGARYASGEDVTQDYTQAVKWFTRAADNGQVLAAATLGAYYWAGRGVPQDDVSAYMWSAIAKEGGDEASKYRLAILRARMTGAQIAEAEQRAGAWRRTHGRTHPSGRTTQP
ncbi:MAG TPA: GAF domain-containing protein [Terriglobales bacterium]|nr:GAF domain-containing protein [Terriglobales bacterium]